MRATYTARRLTETTFEITYTEKRWFRKPTVLRTVIGRSKSHGVIWTTWFYVIDDVVDENRQCFVDAANRAAEQVIARELEDAKRAHEATLKPAWTPVTVLPAAKVVKS